jgi:hypothetical protein
MQPNVGLVGFYNIFALPKALALTIIVNQKVFASF